MRTAILVVCGLLVGALIGAWIVHLSENNHLVGDLQAELALMKNDKIELGRRLNECLLARLEEHEKMKQPGKAP